MARKVNELIQPKGQGHLSVALGSRQTPDEWKADCAKNSGRPVPGQTPGRGGT